MNRIPHKDSDSDPLIPESHEHAEPFIEIDTKNRSGRLNVAPRHQILLVCAIGLVLILVGIAAVIGTIAYLLQSIDFQIAHLGFVAWLLFSFLCLWWFPEAH